jgi:hypothetical protein
VAENSAFKFPVRLAFGLALNDGVPAEWQSDYRDEGNEGIPLPEHVVSGKDSHVLEARRFVCALLSLFLTHLSQPLGPLDIFSRGCRPSRTAHLPVSSRRS